MPECLLMSVACVLKEQPAAVSNIDCCSFNATMYVVWTDAGMQAGAALDLFKNFIEYLTGRSLKKTPLHCSAYISKHLRFVQCKMIGQLNCVVETTMLQPANQSDHMQNKTKVKLGSLRLQDCHS